MGFVDTLMSGRYDSTDLAAISLGAGLWLPVFLTAQGILIATTPFVAHLVGANKLAQTQKPLIQGGCFALLLTLLAVTLLYHSQVVLTFMSVPAELQVITYDYLQAIAWGFPALLGFQLLRSYIEGFGKTRPAMVIALVGLSANIPLNYIFIYGKFGLPEMGGVGCGWATTLVVWLMFFMTLAYVCLSRFFQSLQPFRHWQLPQLQELSSFIKLGLPIGFALLIEASMFSVISLLLADLGEVMIASHQVTMSFTGMVFMVPLSLAMALTIRVSHQLGAGKAEHAMLTVKTGLTIAIIIAALSALMMLSLSHEIVALYTQDTRIVNIAVTLIMIAAMFQFSDAIQITSAGALRGYKDTTIPLIMVFIAYWMIGLPTGYILGKTDLLMPAIGPKGFWIGLLIGLTIGATLLLSRLIIVGKRHIAMQH